MTKPDGVRRALGLCAGVVIAVAPGYLLVRQGRSGRVLEDSGPVACFSDGALQGAAVSQQSNAMSCPR